MTTDVADSHHRGLHWREVVRGREESFLTRTRAVSAELLELAGRDELTFGDVDRDVALRVEFFCTMSAEARDIDDEGDRVKLAIAHDELAALIPTLKYKRPNLGPWLWGAGHYEGDDYP